MKYIINTRQNPYFNMAFDEYCLECIESDEPVFFLWQNDPTVVIGANQNVYKEIDLEYLESNKIHLVRRITGGGAVFHDDGNLNFTFVGKYTYGEDVFKEYLGYIVDALSQMGVPNVELGGRNDILMSGDKISGCAKRIHKDRCMVHGTLLYDVDTEKLRNVLNGPKSKLRLRGTESVRKQVVNLKEFLPNINNITEFRNQLENILSEGHIDEMVFSDEQLSEIEKQGVEKYSSQSWVYGKLAESNICYENKFACGTVEAEMVVDNGVVVSIQFNGDFIGNSDIREFEKMIEGEKYSYSCLVELFDRVCPSKYLDKITSKECAELLLGQ